MPPRANVTAVPDTQGNGKGHPCASLTVCNGVKGELGGSREHVYYHLSVTIL